MDPLIRSSLLSEIHVLESLSHKNIVKIYDCIDSGKIIAVVLELVSGLPLNQHLEYFKGNKLSETDAIIIFKQIASAVDYCHSKGIAHRDLKFENILITKKKEAKIIDCGLSIWVKEGKIKIFSGTPTYMAPEIITRTEYDGSPTDIWALGVILYSMICGKFPFNSSVESELYRQIAKGVYSVSDGISAEIQKLIGGMLKVDPKRRITSHQIIKLLS